MTFPSEGSRHFYGFGQEDGRAPLPPDHGRIVRSLSDADLEDEILSGLGEPDYRLALLAEAERRGRTLPAPS